MKGYTKLTAALAAFVLLFIAIGVSTTGTASAQGVILTVTIGTTTNLGSDGKTDNTICSTTAPPSTCSATDGTFLISVTDTAATTVTVDVKNTDLATVGDGTGQDDNKKNITLIEIGSSKVFTRMVRSKKASTGLVADADG
ncbi:MAG: hypothetical protein IIC27_01960, partial [Chloroflexi bacterium]|nr:hypothetical protein [Chloroflexota bacterium]